MEKIRSADLDQRMLSSQFIILDFSSPGCAPCRKIAQGLPALLDGIQPATVAAFEIDITSEPAIAARFFVLGVPTLILFKEGKEIGRFNSLPKTDTIKRLLS